MNIANVRIYQKTKLNRIQSFIKWLTHFFYKENYPVDMVVGFLPSENWVQFTAEVKNSTNQDASIIKAFGLELRWDDLKDKLCSKCSKEIEPKEWSHINALFQRGVPIKYTRYCGACYVPDYMTRPVDLLSIK